jgi:hypothetical protein
MAWLRENVRWVTSAASLLVRCGAHLTAQSSGPLARVRSPRAFGLFMAYTGDPYEVVFELERLGEERVRELLSTREFGDPGSLTRSVVEGWLSRKESSHASRRADRALSISRKALVCSITATISAIIAMIVAASDKVILFLHWVGVLKP